MFSDIFPKVAFLFKGRIGRATSSIFFFFGAQVVILIADSPCNGQNQSRRKRI